MIKVIFFENYQGFAKDKIWTFSPNFANKLITLGVAYDAKNPPVPASDPEPATIEAVPPNTQKVKLKKAKD